tara:strand:+ start:2533 stop:2922 length:390 start_codon:yes stop_codon:yes gene_type:complete
MSRNNKKDLKEFGLLIGFAFPIVIGLVIPYIWGHSFRFWTLFIGIPSVILAFLKPSLLKYPYKYWIKTGEILGWINSRIIFGIVFVLVLQPIAFIMYLLGYDPLRKKFNNEKSYRELKEDYIIDYERIF